MRTDPFPGCVMSLPPPDELFPELLQIDSPDARVYIVGLTEHGTVEVFAGVPERKEFYRFVLPKSARVVRKFWQSIGVISTARLAEGAYDSKEGYGPIRLVGSAIGRDIPAEGEDSCPTLVLTDVTIWGA